MRIFALIISIFFIFNLPATAETKRYASIVVDADTLDIVHARQIDELRYPASLTKVMTLYLTFDAINAGQLRLDERLVVSRHASLTPPFGLGLKTGQTITVDQAIQAVAVRSANDAAVVLAERIAGSEEAFIARMNSKSHQLGMLKTTFKTPHGLPDPEQRTTARDMAKMASSIMRHHKRYYHYFGQTHFTWNGRTKKNTNGLLHWLAGVDGFKTGYTRDSGYNLIISAQRDGRRLIAIVLGGASGKSRNQHMQDLVEKGFDVMGVNPVISRPPVVVTVEDEPDMITPQLASVTTAVRLRGRNSEPITVFNGNTAIKVADRTYDQKWSVQLGAFYQEKSAKTLLAKHFDQSLLSEDSVYIRPGQKNGRTLYSARFTGLSATQAEKTCETLRAKSQECMIIAPG